MAKIVGMMFGVMSPLMENPGAGGGGGGDNTSGNPGAGNDGVVKPDAGGAVKPEGGSPNPGSAPDRKAEDERNRGILDDLRKERKARQDFERQVNGFKTELELERGRVRALSGLTPKSEAETETEAVRQRFGQVFPDLAGITKEDIQAIRELRQQAQDLQAATAHHWELHGQRMLDSVVEGVSKALGGTLSDRQAARVKNAYFQEAEGDPKFLARHDKGDPKLIEEFVRNWVEDWFEPARRKVTQTEVERMRRVPGGRDRSAPGNSPKKIDFNDPKALEDALVASFKEHGGEFGN